MTDAGAEPSGSPTSGSPASTPALPKATPVVAGGRLGSLVVVAVAAALVAFGIGYRLGPGPAPSPTLRPSPLVSPGPPDVETGAVSDRLRAAYGVEGSDWATCTLATVPTCMPLNHKLWGIAPDPRAFASSLLNGWESLGPRKVPGPRLVLVADLRTDVALAFMAGPLAPGETGAPAETPLVQVASSDGIFYFDLGSLAPGRYVVVVGELDPSGPVSGPCCASPPAGWWTYEAAFEVR